MRVLLCRAQSESLATARALNRFGIESVIAPVLAIEPLPFKLPGCNPDAVLATSARAIEALTSQQAARLAAYPAFAVGARTAETWRRAGFATVATADGNVSALANLIVAALLSRARLLYVAGRIRKPDLEAALKAAGYLVEVVETYAACTAAPWDGSVRTRFQAGEIDAVLHYSARSAALSARFAKQAGCEAAFARAPHFCISTAVAAAICAEGVQEARVAASPTDASLAQALLSTLASR